MGAVTWRTLHVSMYDWQGAGSSFSGAEFFTSHNVDMALLVGELKGPCATVPCIALAFDLDDNDVRKHYLIPLVRATENLHYVALTATHGGTRAWATNPCDSDTFCDDTYRDRLKQALDEFGGCMKGMVVPIGLPAVACFVLCAPFLAGSPLAYAACVAVCEAGVAAGGIIDYTVCDAQLQAAKENALASYCACLQYKLANCPNMAETDIHGCP